MAVGGMDPFPLVAATSAGHAWPTGLVQRAMALVDKTSFSSGVFGICYVLQRAKVG